MVSICRERKQQLKVGVQRRNERAKADWFQTNFAKLGTEENKYQSCGHGDNQIINKESQPL